MRIEISGPAVVSGAQKSPADLIEISKEISGSRSSGSCTDFLDLKLQKLDPSGGHIELRFDENSNQMRVVTIYDVPGAVSEEIAADLTRHTQGQWSDGLGEGCFDALCEVHGISLDLNPLDHGEDVTVRISDDKPSKPKAKRISIAAREGDLSAVMDGLDQGADINELNQGATPLIGATLAGHREVALALIDRGADVHFRDEGICDALMATALSNKISDPDATAIATALIAKGVSPIGERDGLTPLEMAGIRGRPDLAALFQSHGAVE